MTVERFVDRYRIERAHAARVAAQAVALYRRVAPDRDLAQTQLLAWAALLHEIGMSVAHLGFHKHGAYILQHADMPGFSAGEQSRLAILVYGCRGGLAKVSAALSDPQLRAQLLSLRLAVLFHHARTIIALPRIRVAGGGQFAGGRIGVGVSERWLAKHPLTAHLLAKERRQWKELGHPWKNV
jgi:exopolyphosphatase/guanosine-5'-triphosphate,3'-diphosphate pyrophosphatase